MGSLSELGAHHLETRFGERHGIKRDLKVLMATTRQEMDLNQDSDLRGSTEM